VSYTQHLQMSVDTDAARMSWACFLQLYEIAGEAPKTLMHWRTRGEKCSDWTYHRRMKGGSVLTRRLVVRPDYKGKPTVIRDSSEVFWKA
jgi:hypothetical protein